MGPGERKQKVWKDLTRVVQKVDKSLSSYPVDSVVCFVNNYPLSSNLLGG